jgi:hypothetical protein
LRQAGYAPAGTEGFIYATAQPGTVPLYSWTTAHRQHLTAVRPPAAGWSPTRVEGWVFADRPYELLGPAGGATGAILRWQVEGTVPFASSRPGISGYVYRQPQPGLIPVPSGRRPTSYAFPP